MRHRFSVAMSLCAGVGIFLSPAAIAANVAPVQAPTPSGVIGPTVVVPLNMGGPSLQGVSGAIDLKPSLSNLPVVPGVNSLLPSTRRIGQPKVDADFLRALGLPQVRMGFTSDAAPPSLPHSAIPGASQQTNHEGFAPPVNPGANAIENMAELGRPVGWALSPDIPGGLKPGSGGELPSLRRQSLRLAAKADAVKAQLRAAGGGNILTAEEGAQGLGQQLMNILTDERTFEGSAKSPTWGSRVDSSRPQDPVSFSGTRLLAQPSGLGRASMMTTPTGWAYQVPAVQGGYWIAYRKDSETGVPAPEQKTAGDVALLALQVSRQSLILSVVDAPARTLAMRWANDSVHSLAGDSSVVSGSGQALAATELRDAVASPSPAETTPTAPLSSPVQSAQSEIFAYLQSAGDAPSVQAEPAAPQEAVSRNAAASESDDNSPVSSPDPLLACALLPFLGLLILRSRLFS